MIKHRLGASQLQSLRVIQSMYKAEMSVLTLKVHAMIGSTCSWSTPPSHAFMRCLPVVSCRALGCLCCLFVLLHHWVKCC